MFLELESKPTEVTESTSEKASGFYLFLWIFGLENGASSPFFNNTGTDGALLNIIPCLLITGLFGPSELI